LSKRPKPLTRAAAEAIGAEALAFIAAEPYRLQRFMAEAGLSPDRLKADIEAPTFLGGALDFLLGEEALLLAFVERLAIAPELPAMARRLLP